MPSHLPHCTKQKYYTQIDKKVAYKQFQDSRFPEIVQWETASAEPSAWKRSVFLCSKLINLLNTRLEFPIYSLWPAAELLSRPSYVMSSCKSAIVIGAILFYVVVIPGGAAYYKHYVCTNLFSCITYMAQLPSQLQMILTASN